MELEFEKKRLNDLAARTEKTGALVFTRFLDPALISQASVSAQMQHISMASYGGHPEAERRICAFYTYEEPQECSFPIRVLLLEWNKKFSSPDHRDILGAVMALGIERQTVGDISILDGSAYMFVLDDVAEYISANLESAGRTPIKISIVESVPDLPPPIGTSRRIVLSSQRLDCAISAAFNLSRSDSQRQIRSGNVRLNYMEETHTDMRVENGDIISVRGLGRFKLVDFTGETRRGRMSASIFVYGK